MWSHIQTDGSGDLSTGLECVQVATETSQFHTRCSPDWKKNRAAGCVKHRMNLIVATACTFGRSLFLGFTEVETRRSLRFFDGLDCLATMVMTFLNRWWPGTSRELQQMTDDGAIKWWQWYHFQMLANMMMNNMRSTLAFFWYVGALCCLFCGGICRIICGGLPSGLEQNRQQKWNPRFQFDFGNEWILNVGDFCLFLFLQNEPEL